MNVYYFAPKDVQIARVDRQCIMRFSEALARRVNRLKVISAKTALLETEPTSRDDLYAVYGVSDCFEVVQLEAGIRQGKWTSLDVLRVFWAYLKYAVSELPRRENGDIAVYVKNYLYALPMIVMRRIGSINGRIVFEIHSVPKNVFQWGILNRSDKIVSNSHALKKDLSDSGKLKNAAVLSIHQGVNLAYIEGVRISKEDARTRLRLPQDAFLAVYTGKVFDGYEEIQYYIEAAEQLHGEVTIVIVGGRPENVARLRERCQHLDNLKFVEFVPPSEIYYYHFAADALLLYYPPGIKLNKYRSPGKLFEYMASGNPILAADYPVLEEVLENGRSALIVEKANPDALAEGLRRLKNDSVFAEGLACQALRDVERFTWEARADRIYEFIRAQ